jgi:nucleoside phosphorylase
VPRYARPASLYGCSVAERPSIGDLRVGVRRARAAECGSDVVRLLRPRTLGFIRTRGPIWLQLRRADLDGRLIWHGPDSYAMLRRPADRAVEGSGRLLRLLDRHWNLAVMVGEFLIFLVVALVLVALRQTIGPARTWLGLGLVEILLLLAIVADQVVALLALAGRGLRALGRPRPRIDQVAAEQAPFELWTMALCHHIGPAEQGHALLADVAGRLAALGGADVALACPRDAITTRDMRTRVGAWADDFRTGRQDPELSVLAPRQLPARTHRVTETGAFFFVWLAGVAALAFGMATSVASWERGACADLCAGRPVTFPAALEWVGYRLMWRYPAELTAETFWSRSMGILAGFFLPMTIAMAGVCLVLYSRYRRKLTDEYRQAMDEALRQERVLLLVATPVERAAVIAQARPRVDAEAVPEFSEGHPVYRLGSIGGVEVVLAQVGAGATSPVSAAYSVPRLIDEWRPSHVIMVGICFGLHEERQRLGDIIVGRQLRVINLRAGETEDRDRGDAATAGHRLVERFAVAEPPPGVRVWTGVLLSWDVLVDSSALREALKTRYPDAEGGEMEGAAVYASSVREGIEWIVVKGICDWGRDKNSAAQELAATNAATLVLDLIAAGALARRGPGPRDRERRGENVERATRIELA